MLNKIAYRTIYIFGKVFNPFIKILEKNKIKFYLKFNKNFSPIFIIGVPRSGSTFLYQIIVNYFKVIFPNNLIKLIPENLYLGFWLTKIFNKKLLPVFNSNYGDTTKYGLFQPSEFGGMWDKIHLKENENDKHYSSLRNCINAIMNKYDMPIVFKNLRTGLVLKYVTKIFPSCRIIVIDRDPFFVAQSIYLGKKKNGIAKEKFLGVYPSNLSNEKYSSEIESIVSQIHSLKIKIHNDLNNFVPKENIISIKYEDIFENLNLFIERLSKFIKTRQRVDEAHLKNNLHFSNLIKVNEKIKEEIIFELSKKDWSIK